MAEIPSNFPLFVRSQEPLGRRAYKAHIQTLGVTDSSWWSGSCYLNKGECDLNQSKDDSFVKQVAKNNNWNNGDRQKIHEIFLINCFVFVIILVWQTVHKYTVREWLKLQQI